MATHTVLFSLYHSQHFTIVEKELVELGKYTKLVILKPGEILYEDHNFHLDRGLFFIEEGTLVRERFALFVKLLCFCHIVV